MNADAFWRIDEGDCRAVMRAMEPASVHMVMTSPPYWGLRDYDTATWEGGDPDCDHKVPTRRSDYGQKDVLSGVRPGADVSICGRCGAERFDEQIGLELTPQEYVAEIIDVFKEVWRVLRDDGTVWLNLGDSYNANPKGSLKGQDKSGLTSTQTQENTPPNNKALVRDLKPKDLIGIPWRVAFALQDAGWYLRSEIIWAKPNPMPASVTDRPTNAHEQVFLLSKAPRYSYDAFAVREEDTGGHASGNGFSGRQGGSERVGGRSGGEGTSGEWEPGGGRNRRSVWEIATVPYKEKHFATFPPKLVIPCVRAGTPEAGVCVECGAPRKRIVQKERVFDGEAEVEGAWDLDEGGRIGADGVGHWRKETRWTSLGWRPTCVCGAPEGMKPDDLDLIATPTGESSKPDPSREVGRAGYSRPRGGGGGTRTITRFQQRRYAEQLRALGKEGIGLSSVEITDDAWAHYIRTDAAGGRPLPPALLECLLDEGQLEPVDPPEWEPPGTRPAVVFDPFAGAATTGIVALREGRSFVGAELSPRYAEKARERVREDGPLFNVAAEAP